MQEGLFGPDHLDIIEEAVSISEEVACDYFSALAGRWIRYPYEICTLRDVCDEEHPVNAFAHLVWYGTYLMDKQSGKDSREFYRICLNDPNILDHTSGGRPDRLLPFMIYVITHELVHITRFSTYNFHPGREDKTREEEKVHCITGEILAPVRISGLDRVLDRFKGHQNLS
ncbi:MAG TPA: hypothetical protein EYP57_09935 [Thermodesulfobacteriaceae bacterium]|nr:hypothetical protein [Thermodesulfobacteriaceae bacterium]